MPDQNFFKKSKNFKVSEICEMLSCTLSKRANPDLVLEDVAPLDKATERHLSFLDNVKYKEQFLETRAGACFVSPQMAEQAREDVVCLITENPYKSYALAAQAFYPEYKPEMSQVEKTAQIHKRATVGKNVNIGHNVVIEDGAIIGNNTWIEPNAFIGRHVQIGENCRIGPQAYVSHAIIGDYVRLYPGVCIGQDGFGFAIDPAGHVKVPQLGRVIIEDHVEIGANTTVDRGSGPDTVIGQGTWIDNLVQIGHNVEIGRGCVIVAQVGLSGSVKIKDYVAIGGQAGVAGHLTIGTGAKIGAQAGIIKDVPPGQEYFGTPAFPRMQFYRQVAALNNLIKKEKKD